MTDEVGVSGDGLLRMLDGLGTRMDAGLSRIETKLDNKADKVDLARINARLDEHSTAIANLENQQRADEVVARAAAKQKEETTSNRQKLWNISLTSALVLVGLLGVLGTVFHW